MISTKVLNPHPTSLPLANVEPVTFWCSGAYNAMVKNHMQKSVSGVHLSLFPWRRKVENSLQLFWNECTTVSMFNINKVSNFFFFYNSNTQVTILIIIIGTKASPFPHIALHENKNKLTQTTTTTTITTQTHTNARKHT